MIIDADTFKAALDFCTKGEHLPRTEWKRSYSKRMFTDDQTLVEYMNGKETGREARGYSVDEAGNLVVDYCDGKTDYSKDDALRLVTGAPSSPASAVAPDTPPPSGAATDPAPSPLAGDPSPKPPKSLRDKIAEMPQERQDTIMARAEELVTEVRSDMVRSHLKEALALLGEPVPEPQPVAPAFEPTLTRYVITWEWAYGTERMHFDSLAAAVAYPAKVREKYPSQTKDSTFVLTKEAVLVETLDLPE